jgi:prepilin-type N-terminal cleavage/methylation domain-containing protein
MRSRSASSGFTLVELMVTVSVIAILSLTALISVQRDQFERRREALNTTVRDLASWIDLIRTRAATTTTACTVTIAPPGSLNAGGTLASVSPASCASTSAFTLDADAASQAGALVLATNPTPLSPATSATILLTTEGGAQFTPTTSVSGFDGLEVALSSSSANLKRCLAISAGTGNLLLGAANTSGGTCSYTNPL